MDDIGLLKFVAERGFGFAASLTGDRTRDVFLNESRIARLGLTSSLAKGMLIRMRTAQNSEGGITATRVEWLDLASPSTTELARKHLAKQIGDKQAASLPSPVLHLLWGTDRAVDTLLRPVFASLPNHAWLSAHLLDAMELCPAVAWEAAIPQHISTDPARSLSVLKREVCRDPSRYCPSKWLHQLWDTLPDQRGDVLIVARAANSGLHAQDAAAWARAAIDHYHILSTASGSEATVWWEILETAIEKGAKLDKTWHNWPGWQHAPWRAVRIAIRHWQSDGDVRPLSSVVALEEASYQSQNIGRMSARRQLEALGKDDLDLADLWSPLSLADADTSWTNAVRAQMLTARAAENCAITYFRALGHSVEDIAVMQLTGGVGEWLQMDLRVDDCHGVDVKNLRRTINGGMHASRWKVKEFKRDSAHKDVLLCGVSSPHTFFLNEKLTCDADEDMHVLGVTTFNEIGSLAGRFASIFSLRINPASKLIELPAWSWDYPHSQYRERDATMTALRSSRDSLQSTEIGRRCLAALPPVVLSFWNLVPEDIEEFNPQQLQFLEQIRNYLHHGSAAELPSRVPRLPWLYLFILHLWAKWRSTSSTADSIRLLRLFLWHPHSHPGEMKPSFPASTRSVLRGTTIVEDGSGPLGVLRPGPPSPSAIAGSGIIDPANTIDTLVRALAVLEDHLSQAQFLSISDITHSYNGVLVGTFPDGQRKTLLAHCCGRLSSGIDCGNRPLVFGRHQTCTCGRLICNKCSTCTDTRYASCEHQNERLIRREQAPPKFRPPGRR